MVTLIVRNEKGEHKTEWPDPMKAIAALMHDCDVDGGFGTMYEAEVFLEVNGEQVRQLKLVID